MDTNPNGEPRKPRRPRIGQQPAPERHDSNDSGFEKVAYGSQQSYPRSSYSQQPRQHNYDRPDAGYGQQRPAYNQQRPNYNQQRPRYNTPQSHEEGGEGGYNQSRPRYNNQDGYQPRPRYNQEGSEGGYQPRPRYNNQEGYQPRPRYNNQEGYQPRPRYNQDGGEGGYQPRPRYNNYNPGGGEGGYQPRPNNNNRKKNQGQKPYKKPGKSFTPRPKQIDYELPPIDPNEEVRLNKFIANAGICSRREADELIQQGKIKVNGNVVTELGVKITAKDVVEYEEQVVVSERKCYVLLNKPKDCVTTSDDPNGRLTVLDLVKGACKERIYPVGRLDRNTTGVLLLTNDGDLASRLTHPQYVKKKIYHVWTDHDIAEEDMQRIADGIELEDGEIHADAISYATETDRNQAGIEIHSGRNRVVRRMFEALGYHVTKLDRVYFAGLTKKNLPRGRWRYLTQEEVNFLKMGSFE